jgi:alpha-L-fucosidase 2
VSLKIAIAASLLIASNSLAQTPKPAAKARPAVRVDYAGAIGRSDVILAQPNLLPSQAMPLGNGRLGVAVWAADGLTAQLNRVDTMPDRVPLARLILPGLAQLTQAKDYTGRLDLYNAEFHEQGGAMSASIFVSPSSDVLILDITGADPSVTQTAQLIVAQPRSPRALAAGNTAILSESWLDNQQPGASGRSFGTLAAITADAKDITTKVVDTNTVSISFHPNADGHFRILVAGPHYDQKSGPPTAVANAALKQIPHGKEAIQSNQESWHAFWHHADFMKITSPDGVGEYMENLRTLYLFAAAAESRSEYPGSQAGIADMFSAVLAHQWDPAAFWHWNLRMQVAANLSAGVPELNTPYFNLYRENIVSIEAWTKAHMHGRPGICIPETMRFNGPGIEYETWDKKAPIAALNCDADSKPYYNARTISTGAEVSLWIWQQYLATNNRAFLAHNFPVMVASAQFLLSYETPGDDGLLHTSPSNAHETMWDVQDPTTDLSAREALFPATIQAAKLIGGNASLIGELGAALKKIPPLPRTEAAAPKTLLPASADAQGNDVIAASYAPATANSNVENIGLEPLWPYNLIADNSPLFAVAKRTYEHRPYPTNQDWSYDPIQAARLHLSDEVRSTLIKLTETYQHYVNGFASWGGESGEFYTEQQGVVAAALQEALVQDYDGTIRINPAFPHDWDVDGRVSVRGNTKVNVQLHKGAIETVVIEAGTTGPMQIRNPWPDTDVEVASPGTPTVTMKAESTLKLKAVAGKTYLLSPAGKQDDKRNGIEVTGTATTEAKKLGPVQIGLFPRP